MRFRKKIVHFLFLISPFLTLSQPRKEFNYVEMIKSKMEELSKGEYSPSNQLQIESSEIDDMVPVGKTRLLVGHVTPFFIGESFVDNQPAGAIFSDYVMYTGDGREMWRFKREGTFPESDYEIVTTDPIIAIWIKGKKDKTSLVLLDPQNGKQLWRVKLDENIVFKIDEITNSLLVFSHGSSSSLDIYDLKTGAVKKKSIDAGSHSFVPKIEIREDRIFVIGEEIIAFEMSGGVLWKIPLSNKSHVVSHQIADGQITVAQEDGQISGFSFEGKSKWTANAPQNLISVHFHEDHFVTHSLPKTESSTFSLQVFNTVDGSSPMSPLIYQGLLMSNVIVKEQSLYFTINKPRERDMMTLIASVSFSGLKKEATLTDWKKYNLENHPIQNRLPDILVVRQGEIILASDFGVKKINPRDLSIRWSHRAEDETIFNDFSMLLKEATQSLSSKQKLEGEVSFNPDILYNSDIQASAERQKINTFRRTDAVLRSGSSSRWQRQAALEDRSLAIQNAIISKELQINSSQMKAVTDASMASIGLLTSIKTYAQVEQMKRTAEKVYAMWKLKYRNKLHANLLKDDYAVFPSITRLSVGFKIVRLKDGYWQHISTAPYPHSFKEYDYQHIQQPTLADNIIWAKGFGMGNATYEEHEITMTDGKVLMPLPYVQQFQIDALEFKRPDQTFSLAGWGVVDTSGRILPPEEPTSGALVDSTSMKNLLSRFKEVRPFRNGQAVVWADHPDASIDMKEYNTGNAIINEEGEFVFKPGVYNRIYDLEEGYYRFATNEEKYGFIDLSGKVVLAPVYQDADDFRNGYAKIEQGGQDNFINYAGEKVMSPSVEKKLNSKFIISFAEGLIKVLEGATYKTKAFYTPDGKRQIKVGYEDVGDFKDGYSFVKTESGYNYLDKNGKLLFKESLSVGEPFRNGYASISIDGKWGAINTKGEIVIAPQFSYLGDFVEGVAAFRQLEKRWSE